MSINWIYLQNGISEMFKQQRTTRKTHWLDCAEDKFGPKLMMEKNRLQCSDALSATADLLGGVLTSGFEMDLSSRENEWQSRIFHGEAWPDDRIERNFRHYHTSYLRLHSLPAIVETQSHNVAPENYNRGDVCAHSLLPCCGCRNTRW